MVATDNLHIVNIIWGTLTPKHSIGICYVGGLDAFGNPADTRTPEQKMALSKLVYQLMD